jgi:hypothetical protein
MLLELRVHFQAHKATLEPRLVERAIAEEELVV